MTPDIRHGQDDSDPQSVGALVLTTDHALRLDRKEIGFTIFVLQVDSLALGAPRLEPPTETRNIRAREA